MMIVVMVVVINGHVVLKMQDEVGVRWGLKSLGAHARASPHDSIKKTLGFVCFLIAFLALKKEKKRKE